MGYGKFPLPPEKMVTWFESMGIAAPDVIASYGGDWRGCSWKLLLF